MADFRAHDWISLKTLKPVYSVQARVGKNGWSNIFHQGKPMFFDTKEERDAAMKEMEE